MDKKKKSEERKAALHSVISTTSRNGTLPGHFISHGALDFFSGYVLAYTVSCRSKAPIFALVRH